MKRTLYLEQIKKHLRVQPICAILGARQVGKTTLDCYFWSTSNEAELDLLVFKNGKRLGFEFKYSDSPKVTKSMHIALQDLKLDHLYVIFPGTMNFAMHDKITACGLEVLAEIKV